MSFLFGYGLYLSFRGYCMLPNRNYIQAFGYIYIDTSKCPIFKDSGLKNQ